jgi:hypothetical protein
MYIVATYGLGAPHNTEIEAMFRIKQCRNVMSLPSTLYRRDENGFKSVRSWQNTMPFMPILVLLVGDNGWFPFCACMCVCCSNNQSVHK